MAAPVSREENTLDRFLGRGAGIYATASFTPVAAAYAAGDIIGAAQELAFKFADGSAIPQGAIIRVVSTVLKIDAAALVASEGAYTAQFYSATPPSAQADNAAWSLASADLSVYRGALGLGTPVDLGAACYIKTQQSDQQDMRLVTSSLWARLLTVAGFTIPAVDRQLTVYGVIL